MKLTLPQLRKLVESTVKDVMKSKKKSLREESHKRSACPACDSEDIVVDSDNELFNVCNDCGQEWPDNEDDDFDAQFEKESDANQRSFHQPDFKAGGMKASLDRHVKETKMRTRRR